MKAISNRFMVDAYRLANSCVYRKCDSLYKAFPSVNSNPDAV